jgi:hypothetical protein
MGLLGYTKKTSFKTSLAVAQISEFSLIFILLGARNGQISEEIVSLLMVVAIITIAVSSYMIIYADSLYKVLERFLRLFERKKVRKSTNIAPHLTPSFFGFRKGGSEYAGVFKQLKKRFTVIDYDPDAIDDLEKQNVPYIYGDATDLEMLEEIDLTKVKFVVSVMTDHNTNIFILHHLTQHNPDCVVIVHADSVQQAVELYGLGASFVVLPHYIGNEKVSGFINGMALRRLSLISTAKNT